MQIETNACEAEFALSGWPLQLGAVAELTAGVTG
jgi:hypothetical protein